MIRSLVKGTATAENAGELSVVNLAFYDFYVFIPAMEAEITTSVWTLRELLSMIKTKLHSQTKATIIAPMQAVALVPTRTQSTIHQGDAREFGVVLRLADDGDGQRVAQRR
jgi:hypothetical protein